MGGTFDDMKKFGSPSILINIAVSYEESPEFIFEVQIYIDSFLSLKKTQHHSYEFKRARLQDLIRPVLPYYPAEDSHRLPAQAWLPATGESGEDSGSETTWCM